MTETILNWVNICVKKDDEILLLNRQHDNFKGWIQPGGKVEFPESFFEAARRELNEETGLTSLNLELKGISGFTNSRKKNGMCITIFFVLPLRGKLGETIMKGSPNGGRFRNLTK